MKKLGLTGTIYYLLLGIADLTATYTLFTGQQLFSLAAMLCLFALACISGISLLVPVVSKRLADSRRLLLLLVVASVAIGAYETAVNLVPPQSYAFALHAASLISLAAAISVAGTYLLGKYLRHAKGARLYLYAFIGIALIAFLAYSSMYVINTVSWNGVDEIAYNYYAAYLFAHGQNPYAVSMQPILQQYGIWPTVQLNGTYEYAYSYPAFSFLAFLPIPILGITSFFSFIAMLIFIAVAASFAVYRGSGNKNQVLLPVAAWLVATYAFVAVISPYLAIVAFLLIAYAFRHRPIVFGSLLGLAASTTQLAWFALPFFYVLMLKERGRAASLKSIVVSLAVFALVNAYFVATYPAAFGNMFSLLGTTKLPIYGLNVMQLAAVFYALPYSYSTLISAATLLTLLALYYLYPKTLKPLLVIAPMFIFFLSWRNIVLYALPFIPVLLAIYFWRDSDRMKDMLHSKKPIAITLLLLAVFCVAAALPMHQAYVSGSSLSIGRVLPVIYVTQSQYGPEFSLAGLNISMSNTFAKNESVTFLIISRSPNGNAYTMGSMLQPAAPGAKTAYQINYQLPLVNNSTQIAIFAFSQDYTTSRIINFTELGRGAP